MLRWLFLVILHIGVNWSIPIYYNPNSRPCGPAIFDAAEPFEDIQEAATGTTIKVICKHQYIRARATSTCINGQWTEPDPVCRRVTCQIPGTVTNGRYTIEPKHPGVGDVLAYSCNEGYWLEGSKTRKCKRNGEWTGREGLCKKVECPSVSGFNHGYLKAAPPYGYNDEVNIGCYEGFKYDGKPIKCRHNNTWTPIGRCLKWCTQPSNDSNIIIHPISDVYFTNSSISLTCNEGFRYNGTVERTCQKTRIWSGQDGQCERIYCEETNPDISKGKLEKCSPCPYKTALNVTCEVGHIYNGGPLLCGNTSTWLGQLGTCEAVQCGKIPTLSGGLIMSNKTGIFGDKRVVQCNEGLTHEGPGYILCQHTGEWSYPGACRKKDALAVVVTPLCFLLLVAVIIAVFLVRRWKKTRKGTPALRKAVYQRGHTVDNIKDKRIDLDIGFVKLKLVTDFNQNILKLSNENLHPDKHQSLLASEQLNDVNVDQLLSDMEGGGLILLYGRAGVGKTTLVQKLSKNWAKKEWAQSYQAVFVYNMRYISLKDKRVMTLAQFLEDYMLYKPRNIGHMLSQGVNADGEGWVIFMDAIDEFPNLMHRLNSVKKTEHLNTKQQLQAHEWCIHIWQRSVLSKAIIVTTSRHIKGLTRLNPQKSIEVFGLTPETVQEMVDKLVKDKEKAESLKKVLEDNPVLSSVSSITFFCVLLCRSYKEGETLSGDMRTYTRITTFLFQSYIQRNISKDDDDNPDEKTPLRNKDHKLVSLSKLAYQGMVEKQNDTNLAQLVFDEDDRAEAGVSENDLDFAQERGLIARSDCQVPSRDGRKSLLTEFVHLSLQELLAMSHLLSQDPETAAEAFKGMWTSKKFHMAQLFLFGLCFDESISSGSTLFPRIDRESRERMRERLRQTLTATLKEGKKDRHQILRAIQVAYETGSTEVAQEVAAVLFDAKKKISLRDESLTAVDILAIKFMLKSSNTITSLRLQRVKTDENSLNILFENLVVDDKIKELVLTGIPLTEDTIQKLIDCITRNNTLKILKLDYTDINDEMMTKLADKEVLDKITIEELSIAQNPITSDGISRFLLALDSNKTLKKLTLDREHMNPQCMSIMNYLQSVNTSIEVMLRDSQIFPEEGDTMSTDVHLKGRVHLQTFDEHQK